MFATRDMLDRDQRRLGQRPYPPRPISLINGVLLWSPPKDVTNITHYRIYNSAGQLFAMVPAAQQQGEQLKIVGVDTTRVFLTSYDDRTKLESAQTYAVGSVQSTGNSALVPTTEYTLTVATTAIAALPAGSPEEIRFVVIETDGTDGRQITWHSSFKGVTSDDIDNRANYTNIYGFLCRADGNWWLFSRQHYPS